MTQTPTDALRLVRDLAAKGADTPGCNNWRAASMCRQIVEVLDKAAPASPLPGGGDWIDGTPEVPVGSPTWCGWASYEIRRLRSELPAAPTGEPK